MKFPVSLTWRLLCCKLLEQWFSTRADIAPQGTVLAVTSGGGEMLQLLRGERPRMLLNILQCTGLSPTTKNYPVQTPLVLRLRSAAWEPVQLSRAALLCSSPEQLCVSRLAIPFSPVWLFQLHSVCLTSPTPPLSSSQQVLSFVVSL